MIRQATVLVLFSVLTTPALVGGAEPTERAAQYSFDDITISAARADEPIRQELSIAKAAAYLDDGAAAWNGSRKCVTCHTNGTWLTVRPLLNDYLGPADSRHRDFAIEQLRKKQSTSRDELAKSTNPAQVIYIAAGLAEWDAHSSKALSPETAQALDLMFELQQESGTWGSLDCWPPYESDAFHLATVALTAVSAAPGWQHSLTDSAKKSKIDKLKSYLRSTAPPHDYSRMLLLQAATRTPDLLDETRRKEIVDLLVSRQQPDGGWSVRDFAQPEQWGGGNRADKLRSEPEFTEPPSDGHMTGLALIVLRSAGVAKEDTRIQKGIAWLKSNQRESGRWWTRSLNTDTYHFITYSGTAFPLLALAMCDELPKGQ
jgi:squalene-hopene/tetraprenyl-beta-curcumene cyclase